MRERRKLQWICVNRQHWAAAGVGWGLRGRAADGDCTAGRPGGGGGSHDFEVRVEEVGHPAVVEVCPDKVGHVFARVGLLTDAHLQHSTVL